MRISTALHVAHLVVVGDGRDRAPFGVSALRPDVRAVGQQRAVPAPRPERADRRQRKQRRVDRDDRALRREVVGGRAGRRRQQHAVGDQLGEARLAVDQDAQLRGLIGLAEQRDFVEGMELVRAALRRRART